LNAYCWSCDTEVEIPSGEVGSGLGISGRYYNHKRGSTGSLSSASTPNTADGWHSLLTDLLAVAKGDDEGKFWSKIAEMEIPDYENWFTRTYGREKGQALADGLLSIRME
jgi:hypothetical protein